MYNKTVLDNGVRIITEQMDHLQSVSLGVWVNVGSRDETISENGISHFIEHMSFKGTRNRSGLQIAKALDAIGGLSNAFTGKEDICFTGRVLGKHFPILADILTDIFLFPIFDPDDMERERRVILQEIAMEEDIPEDKIHMLFNRLFWTGHPIGMSILGTGEIVSSIRKETILAYIKKYYVPERMLVVAAGNLDHESMVSYFKPFFDPLEKNGLVSERSVPYSNSGVSINFKETEQVHICLGGEAPSLLSEERFACIVLNTVLGGSMSSRLFQEIRENRGLAYSVYSFVSAYPDTGLMAVYVATDPRNANPALEAIQTELKRVSKGEITDADLDAAKEYLIGSIYLSSESADSRMMRLAKNEFVYNRYVPYEKVASDLNKVTVDEVVKVANDIFQGNMISLATLGPIREEELDRNCIQF